MAGPDAPGNRSFLRRAFLWALLLSAVNYWPLAAGKTPLPERIVTDFPLFDGVRPPLPAVPHAELGDAVTQHYPFRVDLRRSLRAGTVPLWNPHLLLGTPFAANLQSAVFYPLNAPLLLLFPAGLAWGVELFLCSFLAVFLTALLARAIGSSATAALAAGAAYGLSGFMVAWAGFASPTNTAVWLPLVLLSVHALVRRPGPLSVALAAAAFALPVLAGQPEVAFGVVALGVAYWAAHAAFRLARSPRAVPGDAARFALAGALALALSAVALLPGVEWMRAINRTLVQRWPLFPWSHVSGFLCRQHDRSVTSFGTPIPEEASYAGVVTLLAAPLAVFSSRKRQAWFFAASLAVSLDFIFGFTPAGRLLGTLPVLETLPRGRLMPIPELSLAMLAALGLTALQERRKAGSPRPARAFGTLLAVTAAGLLGAAAYLVGRHPTPPGTGFLESPWSTAALLVVAWGALRLGLSKSRLASAAFPAALLAVVGLDLLTYSYGHVPFVPRKGLFPQPRVFQWVRAHDPGPYRISSVDLSAPENVELLYGLDSATGYDFVLQTTARFLAPLTGDDPSRMLLSGFKSRAIASDASRRLDLANVKYLLATTYNGSFSTLSAMSDRFRLVYRGSTVGLFENRNVLPRAFLVPAANVGFVASNGEAERRLSESSFDPSREAFVDSAAPGRREPGAPPAKAGAGRAWAWREHTNSVSLKCQALAPALLVVSQAYYPGWRGYVDGAPARLRRVDLALTGLFLSPGRHAIRLVFRPASDTAGSRISLAGLGGLAVLLAAGAARRRRT